MVLKDMVGDLFSLVEGLQDIKMIKYKYFVTELK